MDINKDCARDIMLYAKKNCGYLKMNGETIAKAVTFDELCRAEEFSKYNIDEINYTIKRLEEYNFIILNDLKYNSYIDPAFKNLSIAEITKDGHEFIDNLGNDDVWNRVKEKVKASGNDDLSLRMYYDYIYNTVNEKFFDDNKK